MQNFERSSLNRKLNILSLLSTATALLFVFCAFAVTSIINHRQAESLQLAAFARVIGAATSGDLMLVDRRQAGATLAALEAQQHISAAVLYDRFGRSLAEYRAPSRLGAELPSLEDLGLDTLDDANRAGRFLLSRHMRVVHEVRHGELAVGAIMIEADLLPMWLDILASMVVIGLAMGAALLVSLGLARPLKRSIAEPIARLIQAAQKVSVSQNYALRVQHKRSDELGVLIDSFNTMLAQIEDRGAALLHHRDELERQVGVRTEQLEKAKNAAEAASRAKSGFLATMSHEIRTPMNGVLGMTEMLLATELTEAQRSYTQLVKRSGEHLLVIINDILDFSKIEAGKLTIEYINFNLWDLLDDIHNVYTPQAAAKGLGCDFDIANDIPVAICGDPNRLRQIMANLIGNAIKFTTEGRIMARVRVAGEDAQRVALRFEVHDTGIGISRDARARIFNAFSQADDSTTRKYGGTGLGLAISKQLVELMKGTIGVENAPRQGSIFWFTLSFDKRRVDPDAPGHRQHTLAGLRVLVVDEHEASRKELVQQLEAWRAACEGVGSAAAAFEHLVSAARAGRPYDAAVLDMELTQTSGLALAASVRAEAVARSTHIVLLSPEKLAADPVQRREAGVAYQLVKPARAADLYACLTARAARLHHPAGAATAAPYDAPRPTPMALQQPMRRARRVLLAEDNPVNVEVARAMLEGLGLETHCATNGQEALHAVHEGGWDAVLMDCQMPVMDGFAATGEIRRHEREMGRARALPVIAITANALQGDREACLAAGMDDYLSKPFTQQQLAAVIGRWVALPVLAERHHDDEPGLALDYPPAPSPAPSPPPPPPPAPQQQGDPVNRAALDNIRALSRDAGDALVQKVINAYVGDTPRHLQALRQALTTRDADSLRRIAHGLKSASANIGAARLAATCRDLEQLGRGGSVDGAAPLLADMEREFQSVRQSLHAMLEKES
ncbi:response regulator [Massilia sp. CFBP9012]|uniref:hybrid sensor histidine kinase/response regulator n=1 Tax=Massilia sp. CFBP9012 TaxID=3096531 RepID=UPI002A6A8B52|nr:response regulator [Massilia sp. CFBP9012]MDY0976197.1 response regulator [Massilia sp. CFBP9012]